MVISKFITRKKIEEPEESEQFNHLPAEKKTRITDAFISEFAKKGFRAASMNKIVERAGISKGSIFNYFTSKNQLFMYAYKVAFERVKEYLREVRDETKDEEFFTRFQKVMEAGVRFVKKHPNLARIYYRILYTGDSPEGVAILQEIHAESMKFISSFVEQGVERGEISAEIDVDKAAFILESVLNRFLQVQHQNVLDPSLKLYGASSEESERWIEEMVTLLRNWMGVNSNEAK
ncbi:MAG: TetR/AcrR family transcriptional regulator [Candidatus Marinimicrobia bacterium]|nr:TetR/AcrR family transcriptional regulator [Candidatus Neomarinimicrobiota bacterium]